LEQWSAESEAQEEGARWFESLLEIVGLEVMAEVQAGNEISLLLQVT